MIPSPQPGDRTRYESHTWDDEECIACGVTWTDCDDVCPTPPIDAPEQQDDGADPWRALAEVRDWDAHAAARHGNIGVREYAAQVLTSRRPVVADQQQHEQVADLLAVHSFSHVNSDGWTVCLCGHVAEDDDDDGSHARHQADVVLSLLSAPAGPAAQDGER